MSSASGDLRNVIHTVNGLPENYSGQLTVLLNDGDTFVTLRNLLILQILGTVQDKRVAADTALHLWYSTFIPGGYYTQILACAMPLMLNDGRQTTRMGQRSNLEADIGTPVRRLCAQICSSSDTYDIGDASDEYTRVRLVQVSTSPHDGTH